MKKIIPILIFGFVLSVNLVAQNPPKNQRHSVTVVLKQGEPVKGKFIEADSETVKIEVAGSELVVKIENIAELSFSESNQSSNVVRAIPSGTEALKALQKMGGAIDIGINYQEYGSRLIDMRAIVVEEVTKMPDGELKNELGMALIAFIDAKTAWDDTVQRNAEFLVMDFEPARTIINRYSIPTRKIGKFLIADKVTAINTIWKAAAFHIDRASALIGK